MAERKASRTAVLVCQARAVADGRLAAGRFTEPIAIELLTEAERIPVEQARADTEPRAFVERMEYEMLSATAEVMAAAQS
ncbi:hypothetical protein AB0N05_11120 [Nocardia sp. NPDC051030]|uniref:hypothetical protein n=1 Tax=Nocardia sp. NPDC051030 TaxID=3155162 RepID=UPI003445DAFE